MRIRRGTPNTRTLVCSSSRCWTLQSHLEFLRWFVFLMKHQSVLPADCPPTPPPPSDGRVRLHSCVQQEVSEKRVDRFLGQLVNTAEDAEPTGRPGQVEPAWSGPAGGVAPPLSAGFNHYSQCTARIVAAEAPLTVSKHSFGRTEPVYTQTGSQLPTRPPLFARRSTAAADRSGSHGLCRSPVSPETGRCLSFQSRV